MNDSTPGAGPDGVANNGPRGGWLKPATLVATVLLSFSLVMNIVIDAPVRYEQVGSGIIDAPDAPAIRDDAAARARRAVDADLVGALLTVTRFTARADQSGESPGEWPGAQHASSETETLLRAIAGLSAAGDRAAAGERLIEFLVRYPDHPVSVKIRGRGE